MATNVALAGRIVTQEGILPGAIAIEEGKIARVELGHDGWGPGTRRLPDEWLISPGFIDVQVNGCLGSEMRSDPATARKLRRFLVTRGVTSFCPTVTSLPLDRYDAVVAEALVMSDEPGAEALGLHLEG